MKRKGYKSFMLKNILYHSMVFRYFLIKNKFFYSDLLKRPYLSHDQIENYQLTMIKRLINHAYNNCSYYYKRMEENGVVPSDINSLDDVLRLPILSRKDIFENSEALVAKTAKKLRKQASSGTTRNEIIFYQEYDFFKKMYLYQLRSFMFAGIKPHEKGVWLWGGMKEIKHYDNPIEKFKWWLKNHILIDATDLTDEKMRNIISYIMRQKPSYIVGYVNILNRLAHFISENNLKIPPLKAIISTAEPLLDSVKETIKEAFHTSVYNDYGCREAHHIGFTCSQGHMHILEDINYIELVPLYNNIYKIIVTSLHNFGMPLIRYNLGDCVILDNSESRCDINFKIISNNIVRESNFIIVDEKKMVIPNEIINDLYNIKGIKDFQMLQLNESEILLNIVYNNLFKDDANIQLERIAKDIKNNFRMRKVSIHSMSEINKGPSGKTQHVHSLMV